MANGRGYLGKISAVVSANTGDYVRKLDDSAKRTAAFARTIQSDLTKASREASRSIDAILTPLQRFERAIQNAASARLKFRGIDVAVRTIEDLRRSLAALDSDQEKEFAVRVSGLRNITELKNVLTDIREEDIDLAVNVGGVEGLRRLRNEVQEVNGQQVNIRTERTAAELDTLIAKFSRLSPDRIREIRIAVEARQLDSAILKERQLVSLANEIAAPLSASVAQFDKLTQEVQAGFIPALSAAQNRVEAVRDRIEAGGQVGQRAFRRIADEVRQTTEAIERLSEAQRLVQSIGTGRGLRDTAPQQFSSLSRAAEQTRRSEALSAEVAARFGLGDRQRRVRAAADAVDSVRARRESQELDLAQARRQGNTEQEARLQRQLDGTIQAEQRKTRELDRQLAVQLRQIEAAERLDEAQRTNASSPFATSRGPQGRPLAERFREQERVRAEEDRRAERLADEQRRREVATALLPPVTDLPPDPRQASLERTQALADRLGPDIASSAAALAGLESSTVSLKNQISQLPAPFRTQLIPAIRQAENELLRLTAADDALPEDVERAAASLRQLEQGFRRATSAASLLSSEDAIERVATRESIGQLDAAARVLAQVGAQAGGPVAQAYDRLRAAQQRFILEGTSGTPAARREIEQLQRAVAQAAAATGRISFSRAFREIQRGGDVARGTFSNIGLGVQQVAFIFDDFFAVTGDISQRIRAIGNNVSQLGFVLGGTTGLVVGVAASLIAQGVAGLIKFANSSVEAQDRANAFNESLTRQKTIVEELAQAYEALARSSLDGVFSGFDGVGFERSIRDIRRQQAELAREVAASADPTVRRERAVQSARERELQQESDFGRRIALQAQIEASRARERVASDAANRRLVTPQDATEAVVRRLERLSAALADDSLLGGFSAAVEAQNRARQFAEGRGAPTDAASTAALLRAEIERLTPAAGRSFIGSIPFRSETVEARRAIEEFQTLLAPLDASRLTEISRQNVELIRQAQSAGRALATAQQEAAAAVEAGIPSASRLSFLIDFLGEELEDATNKFNTASEELLAAERQPAGARRDADIARAEERRRIAAQNVNALRGQREQINESIDQLRLLRLTNPGDFASERIRRAEQNISGAGLGLSESVVSQRIREIEARQQSLTAREQQIRSGGLEGRELQNAIADIVRQRAALNEQAIVVQGATRALRSFTDALSRSQQVVESNVQSARQRLDQAREQELALSSPANVREREIAERALREQEQAARAAREVFDIERERIAQQSLDPASDLFDTFQEIARIENRLSARGGNQEERERLIARRAELEGIVARTVRLSPDVRAAEDESSRLRVADALAADGRRLARTPAEAAAIELSDSINKINAEFNLRQRALIDQVANAALIEQPVPDDEVDRRRAQIELDRRAAQRRTIEGASDLGLTEAQRLRRTIGDQFGSLEASAAELFRAGDVAGAEQLVAQGQRNLVRQNAPLFAQFADEVANAVLQGPSRAALQVSDASTSEGQRELNRLLRGEDPARDVNLNELQKQSGFLQIIADAAAKALQQVGIAQ